MYQMSDNLNDTLQSIGHPGKHFDKPYNLPGTTVDFITSTARPGQCVTPILTIIISQAPLDPRITMVHV